MKVYGRVEVSIASVMQPTNTFFLPAQTYWSPLTTSYYNTGTYFYH